MLYKPAEKDSEHNMNIAEVVMQKARTGVLNHDGKLITPEEKQIGRMCLKRLATELYQMDYRHSNGRTAAKQFVSNLLDGVSAVE